MTKRAYTLLSFLASLCLGVVFAGLDSSSVSALTYRANAGVGFTFTDRMSITLSGEPTIWSLAPGSAADSSSVRVIVSTNAIAGYTLSATVGTSGGSRDLTMSGTNYKFASIDTDAKLSALSADNTWGYKVSSDNGSSWSEYNGLPLDGGTSSGGATLAETSTAPTGGSETTLFAIGAKAASTQPFGTYSNVINFYSVANSVQSVSFYDAFAAAGKTMFNGYYRMQDMTPSICSAVDIIGEDSQYQLIDSRDNKTYYVAKLADGNCWMTQNLALELDDGATFTSADTNITENWTPARDTIVGSGTSCSGWANSNTEMYSCYFNSTTNGVYYNWTAALAMNNSSTKSSGDAETSICPKGWHLPKNSTNEFGNMLKEAGVISTATSTSYTTDGYAKLTGSPLSFVLANYVYGGTLDTSGSGDYWSGTANSSSNAYRLYFYSSGIYPQDFSSRGYGYPVRCMADGSSN